MILPLLIPWLTMAGVDSTPPQEDTAVVFCVDLNGSDANSGTRDAPFATLEGARKAIRILRQGRGLPEGGVTVQVGDGRYHRTASFLLESKDNGEADSPIVYRARPGEKVLLSGSRFIDGRAFTPVKDPDLLERIISPEARAHVRQADLNALGFSSLDPLLARGFPHPIRSAPEELFFEGRPMTLARWPNEGFVKTGKVLDPGSVTRNQEKPERLPRFCFENDRLRFWKEAQDLWLFGYFKHDWADESIPVASLDPDLGEIQLARPHWYGVEPGKPFFAENLLEEIDRPGEYYIQRDSGILYFWPPGPIREDSVTLSVLSEPVFQLKEASHLSFEGFIVEESRGMAFHIQGGAAVRVAGCTLRNLGARAVRVEGGTGHRVVRCEIHGTGEGGVALTGGDRRTLTPGRHEALSNHIYEYSRRTATYRPALWLSGCGNRAAHNRIHDAPHSAILFGGNDHLIEYNEIYRVLSRTGDGGAVYAGRDWTIRGTTIRYNYFHDLYGIRLWENGVYIDDQASGITVFGNVFARCHWGMLMGGGRDNRIENNLFVDCTLALHFDARGLGWAAFQRKTLEERLAAVPYREEPWRTRFPELLGMLNDEPMAPKGNVILNNLLVRSGRIDQDLAETVRKHGRIQGNRSLEEDPGFIDPAGGNYGFRDDARLRALMPAFVPIPFNKIGTEGGGTDGDAFRKGPEGR